MIWLNGEEYNGEWKSNLQVLYKYVILYSLEQKLMQISLHYRDASLTKKNNIRISMHLISSFLLCSFPLPQQCVGVYIGMPIVSRYLYTKTG